MRRPKVSRGLVGVEVLDGCRRSIRPAKRHLSFVGPIHKVRTGGATDQPHAISHARDRAHVPKIAHILLLRLRPKREILGVVTIHLFLFRNRRQDRLVPPRLAPIKAVGGNHSNEPGRIESANPLPSFIGRHAGFGIVENRKIVRDPTLVAQRDVVRRFRPRDAILRLRVRRALLRCARPRQDGKSPIICPVTGLIRQSHNGNVTAEQPLLRPIKRKGDTFVVRFLQPQFRPLQRIDQMMVDHQFALRTNLQNLC